jgi:hypothetical protein
MRSGFHAVTAPLSLRLPTRNARYGGAHDHFTGFEVGVLHLPTSLPWFNLTSAELHRQDMLILHPHPRLNVGFRPACFYVAGKLNIADLLAEAGQVGSNLDMLLDALIDSACSTSV